MKLDKKMLINILISLVFVFVVYGVYLFTDIAVDEGTWIIVFLLMMIFLEVSSKDRKFYSKKG